MEDTVKTQTPQLFDLMFSTINVLDEGSGISTPNSIIRRPMYGAHWSLPKNIFGETTAVGVPS